MIRKAIASLVLVLTALTVGSNLAATPAGARTPSGLPVSTVCSYGSGSGVDTSGTFAYGSLATTPDSGLGSMAYIRIARYQLRSGTWAFTGWTSWYGAFVGPAGNRTTYWYNLDSGAHVESIIPVGRHSSMKLAIQVLQVHEGSGKTLRNTFEWVQAPYNAVDCR